MRISLVDAFPNRPQTAEREIMRRFAFAADRLGWTVERAVTSTDILDFKPDLVLTTHEYTPKLTDVPTVGLAWGPPAFYRDDPVRVRNILGYDGHLAASGPIRTWLGDLLFAARKDAPVAGPFWPSCHATPFRRLPDGPWRLFYAGVNWDGGRHGNLFALLVERLPLALAGPAEGWGALADRLVGDIPFDGHSMLDAIHGCGVALCLNRAEHNAAETPSARLFEAAAAGALAIADDLPFVRALFGDSILYVPADVAAPERAARIAERFAWAEANRAVAQEMAAAAHSRFVERFSFDALLPATLPALLDDVRRRGRMVPSSPAAAADVPEVEFLVRIGARPAEMVARCLDSLAAQTHPAVAVLLVAFAEVPELDAVISRYAPRFTRIRTVRVAQNRVRSNALWLGLSSAVAPFVANCDDDDRIHPNHVATLLDVMRERPDVGLAFSGTIRVEEEPGHWFDQENFPGPGGAVIPEPRQLKFLEPFDRTRLWCHENFIQSNAWLVRRDLLVGDVLTDPEMDVGEDLYLYILLSRSTDFATTYRPTAEWNWRSTMKDNASHGHDRWIEARRRIALRTAFEPAAQATEPLRRALLEAEADRAERLRQVRELTRLLQESEADRAARLVSIEKLTEWLKESEADRAARLDVIHALEARLRELEQRNAPLSTQ